MGTGTYGLSIIQHVAAQAEKYGPGAVADAVTSVANRLYGIELQSGPFSVLLQLGAGAKKAPFLLCDQRYVPVLSGRLEYPANNHCIRIRVTIGKHRALPLPQ